MAARDHHYTIIRVALSRHLFMASVVIDETGLEVLPCEWSLQLITSGHLKKMLYKKFVEDV